MLCLVPTAIAAVLPAGLATLNNGGPHGFSEILYAFTSTNANNGSAFAGLGPNLFYNLMTGVNMMFGRFAVAIPALALRGRARRQEGRAGERGHVHDAFADLRRAADRRDRHRRRADVLAGRCARADRRAFAHASRKDVLMLSQRRLERRPKARSLFDRAILTRAIGDSFRKLDPRWQARNPVMFIVEVGAAVTTIFFVRDLVAPRRSPGFDFAISAWLWFTVLFANFAEAVAEGRGKAQADTLRRTKSDTYRAMLRDDGTRRAHHQHDVAQGRPLRRRGGRDHSGRRRRDRRRGDRRRVGDHRRIGAGHSRIGRRPQRGYRAARACSPTRIVVRVTANPGERFLDRMIALVEGAQRQKTPNEIALSILLAGLTIIFLIAVATLAPFSIYAGAHQSVTVLIALLVCLIPTTIGGLLSAIGIAGMDRVMQRNVLAMSGRAVEAAGDVDTLLLDKTGTITLGNRQAVEIIAAPGIDAQRSPRAAYLSSLADETPEGRSIVALAQQAGAREGRSAAGATLRPVQRVHAHERPRPRRRNEDSQGRARRGRSRGCASSGGTPSTELSP